MKKLFLFAFSAMMICSCSDEITSELNEIQIKEEGSSMGPYTSELNFDFLGGERTIFVDFSFRNYIEGEKYKWNMTGGELWCTPSITSGSNDVMGDNRVPITFKITENSNAQTRVASFIISCKGQQTQFDIIQTGIATVHIEKAGTLGDILSDFNIDEIYALTITGNLNDTDILMIPEMWRLTYLDFSLIPLTTLPANGFQYMGLKTVALPNTLQIIPQSLFSYCTNLKSITIPKNVTSIGKSAFKQCQNLTEIYCQPIIPPILDADMFNSISSSAIIYVPRASANTYKNAESWRDYSSMIVEYDFE